MPVFFFNRLHKSALLTIEHIDGLVQDCSKPIANALELLQFCIKPSIYK